MENGLYNLFELNWCSADFTNNSLGSGPKSGWVTAVVVHHVQ